MSCVIIFQAKSLPRCLGLLTIGTGIFNTEYVVLFKAATGQVFYINSTSDGSGNIVVDLTGKELMEMAYTISVKKTDGTSVAIHFAGVVGDFYNIEVCFEDGSADNAIIEAK